MNIVIAIYKASDRKNYKKLEIGEGKLANLKSDELVIQTSFLAISASGKILQDLGYVEDEGIEIQKATIKSLLSDVPSDKITLITAPFHLDMQNKYNDNEITHPAFLEHRDIFEALLTQRIYNISTPFIAKIREIDKWRARNIVDQLEKAGLIYKRSSFWAMTTKVRNNIKHYLLDGDSKKLVNSNIEIEKEAEEKKKIERTMKFKRYGKLETGPPQDLVKNYDDQYPDGTEKTRNKLIKELEEMSGIELDYKKKSKLIEKIRIKYKIGRKYEKNENENENEE